MNNKKIVIITDSVAVALTIAMMVMVLMIYSNLSKLNYDYIRDLGHNWNKGPIESFVPIGADKVCPGKSEFIITDHWPGTVTGCRCPNNTILYNANRPAGAELQYLLTPDTCFRNKFYSDKCTIIPERSEKRYKGWRNPGICGVRSDLTYFEQNFTSTTTNCTGKICGKLDSLNNLLCVTSGATCPVNGIQIINKVPNTNYPEAVDMNTKVLISSHTVTNGEVVNQFKISEGVPCSDLGLEHNTIPYILDKKYGHNNCTSSDIKPPYDPRYIELDSYLYINLLSDNDILPMITGLPDIDNNLLNKKKVSLYYRSYIGVSQTCKSKALAQFPFHRELVSEFLNIEDHVNTKFSPSIVKNVAITFTIFMVGFLLLKLSLSRWFYDNSNQVVTYRKWINVILIYFYVSILLFSLMFISQLFYTKKIYFWLIEDKTCTDTITFQLVSKFNEGISQSIGLNAGIVVISSVLLGLIFMENYLNCCRLEDTKQEQSFEEAENVSLNQEESAFGLDEKNK